MNSYLQPHLLNTDELREHLKKRFPTQDVSQLDRNALIQLFMSYAVPKSRRGALSADDIEPDTYEKPEINGNKRRRHPLIMAPSVETVTNACKKIRLVNTNVPQVSSSNGNRVGSNSQKRQFDSQMDCVMTDQTQQAASETKRKKITWP